MKLVQGSHDEKFSIYRQKVVASLTDTDPLFSGTGVVLENDDPSDHNFDYLYLYIRKMVFDNGKTYQATDGGWTYYQDYKTVFYEDEVAGFDFNQLQVHAYYDTLREESDEINRVFPLRIPIHGGLKFDRDNEKTVLDVRLVIKNFIEKYEYDGGSNTYHYYALSDWLRNVRPNEKVIGGNVHAVARAYVPGETGTISVTNGTGSDQMVIAYLPSVSQSTDFSADATARNRSNNIADFPYSPTYPGDYVEPAMDYLLKLEKYKEDYNKIVAGCADITAYEEAWTDYNEAHNNFRIAPHVVRVTDGGSVSIQNVSPGTYDLYRADVPAYGELFEESAFISIGSVTVTAGTTSPVTFN